MKKNNDDKLLTENDIITSKLSGGWHAFSRESVTELGKGDYKKGHKILGEMSKKLNLPIYITETFPKETIKTKICKIFKKIQKYIKI